MIAALTIVSITALAFIPATILYVLKSDHFGLMAWLLEIIVAESFIGLTSGMWALVLWLRG